MEIYGVCLYVTISKNYREEYRPCQLKLERCNEELMWKIWNMSWSKDAATEDRLAAMAKLKEPYCGYGHVWLKQVFCFNFKELKGFRGQYMKYREGDLDEIF